MNDHHSLRNTEPGLQGRSALFASSPTKALASCLSLLLLGGFCLDTQWSDAAKARKLQKYFQKHGRIYVVVDASAEGVRVPKGLKGDPALSLVLNVRMPQPVHIQDDALESEFSFSGTVFPCHLPMRNIWAAYVPEQGIDAGILWEDDVPESVRTVVSAARKLHEDDTLSDRKEGHQDGTVPEGALGAPLKERHVRHLRIVK